MNRTPSRRVPVDRRMPGRGALARTALLAALACLPLAAGAQRTQKPPLHAQKWLAITGKPLAATAGAKIFQQGGNAVDAACAMLAATATMWDVLSWGGETQALIYDPRQKKVIGVNALGVAPTGATPEFFRRQGLRYPPEYGPLAAVTPGTPGGLLVMLAEYGRLSLAEVLAPAIEMADGYPIEGQTARNIELEKDWLKQWRYSREVMLPHPGRNPEAPRAGEIFRQPDLAATLRKLVEAEREALAAGKDRKAAIMAAYDRFYRGDVAREFVRGVQEEGGLITLDDLAKWQVKLEEPLKTNYRGVDVYKLDVWTQGPALLQALNILENFDLKAMGHNGTRYVHTVYQAMSMAFADRDFWYGDPYFPPEEPTRGLLSKEYAKARAATMLADRNDPDVRPGDPWPYQGGRNPFPELHAKWRSVNPKPATGPGSGPEATPESAVTAPRRSVAPRHDQRAEARPVATAEDAPLAGTTTVVAADAEGWVVSITPSGGWIPAVIAGRTGIGLSQRMQSFVTDPADNPFNVVAPGKRPRVTLTPTLALKDGQPLLAFAVQGGDGQDQNLLQFFLNVVEFGMTVQEATEASNFNSFQLRESFGRHESTPGRILLNDETPLQVRRELRRMGYDTTFDARTSGPINAIWFDRAHGTMWGGSSNHGEDHGIGW